ncbi:MAG: choice-of-anchor B family protein [Bacteroidota bacterium]
MQRILLIGLVIWATGCCLAQTSLNMTKLGQWDDNDLFIFSDGQQYSEVWGYARAGREYALMASAELIHILDITDPSNIVEIGNGFNTFNNSTSIWRDIKVYGDYAYCVADQRSEGLQIIDLSNLPTSASIVYQSTAFFQRTHNIYIDEQSASGIPLLYVLGSNSSAQRDGVRVLSLANPIAPVQIASEPLPGGGYIHDAFVRGDTLYANHGNNGMYIWDMIDPDNPVLLGDLSFYPDAGYNHSSWLTEDGSHIVFCDETFGTGVKIAALTDAPLGGLDINITDNFRSTLEAPSATNSIAHNPYILGDSLVVISYYHEGVQVFDISDPTDVTLAGYYDTWTNSDYNSFDGVWGAYPYLPSGRILGSDVQEGLFVLELDGVSAPLPVTYLSWEAKAEGPNSLLSWATEIEIDNAGFMLQHSRDGRNFTDLVWIAADQSGRYQYRHLNPGTGEHFYRLQQNDFDGSQEFSGIRRLDFGEDFVLPQVWPNPVGAGEEVFINQAGPVQLWSSLGQRVASFPSANRSLVLPADLAKGWYILQLPEGQQQRLLVE